ncbi:unnamed protein product, partial [Didymodactylos carnosus]
MSKIGTLGAYCHLLFELLFDSRHLEDLTVYHCCVLKDDIIAEYKQAVGTKIRWLSFTSTTKDRKTAEFFGYNALFNGELETPVLLFQASIFLEGH